ncbi:MAG: hypothetical protein NTX91_05925 [candidate division SR1 bacterium]|nr:hypothetical protein [candidate division SR1 bacterium]
MNTTRRWPVAQSKIEQHILNGGKLSSSKRVVDLSAKFFIEKSLYTPKGYVLIQVLPDSEDVLLTGGRSLAKAFIGRTLFIVEVFEELALVFELFKEFFFKKRFIPRSIY